MALYDTILTDLTQAMKQKDAQRLGTLRMMKAAFQIAMKEKSRQGEEKLSDEEVMMVLRREAKKRREAAEEFQQAGRADLATTERAEQAIVESYLPTELSDGQIRSTVVEVIGEQKSQNFGAVMGAVMKRLKGQADGKKVKTIVEQCLAESSSAPSSQA